MSKVKVLTQLDDVRLSNGHRQLNKDFVIQVDQKTYVIPKGFITDYSSIPQAFGWIVSWNKVDIAGVVHDYLYSTKKVTRSEADRVWRIIAQSGQNRANIAQAWSCWVGLRVGGWYYWNSKSIEICKN